MYPRSGLGIQGSIRMYPRPSFGYRGTSAKTMFLEITLLRIRELATFDDILRQFLFLSSLDIQRHKAS